MYSISAFCKPTRSTRMAPRSFSAAKSPTRFGPACLSSCQRTLMLSWRFSDSLRAFASCSALCRSRRSSSFLAFLLVLHLRLSLILFFDCEILRWADGLAAQRRTGHRHPPAGRADVPWVSLLATCDVHRHNVGRCLRRDGEP